MPAANRLTRLAAVSALAALAATLLVAASARAADGDIDVRLSGLSSSLNVGGRSDSFSVRLQNRTEKALVAFRVLTVHLDGLAAEHVRVTRGFDLPKQSQEPGVVRFADPVAVGLRANDDRGDENTVNYQIRFLEGAPSGRATVTAEAYVNQERFGRDSDTVDVRGGAEPGSANSPTAVPSNVPTITLGPQVSLSPLGGGPGGDGGGRSGGVPIFLYLMGAVLVIVGGAILWLLLRQRPITATEYPAGYGPMPPYQPAHSTAPPEPGQPYPPGPQHRPAPTAIMPVVRDPKAPPLGPRFGPPHLPPPTPPPNPPSNPPPGVDPWAQPPR